MGNPLKVKIGIAGSSIFVLILLLLLENNFFAPVTIKRWGIVSWDDFQGIPKLFSSYEAAISSSIFLEYDSAEGIYEAYAGQNNKGSWAKRSRDQEYLLNHEQYHFNITELHARMLNDYIAQNPDGTMESYLSKLGSLRNDLSLMQSQYDNETDHSLIFDRQRRWEYEIDSLLTLNNGWVTDHFSGAQVFMSHSVDSSKGVANGLPYRHYVQVKYGMKLSLTSFQTSSINYKMAGQTITNDIRDRSERLKTFSLDSTETFRAFAISDDTSNYTTYQLWYFKNSYLYNLNAKYPNNTGDTTGYAQIASSFIKSFSITNTDAFWISKFEDSDALIVMSPALEMDDENEHGDYCMTIRASGLHGFYRGPIFRQDGAMLLAFDYLVHPDSLHFQDVMLLGKEWHSHQPAPEGQIYFVPATNIPKEKYTIKFGYLLLQDSVKKCYEFYHHELEMTPGVME